MAWFSNQRVVTKLATIGVVGVAVLVCVSWFTIANLREDSTAAAGYKAASSIAAQVDSLRSYYTQEILSRAKKGGLRANYDFADFEDVLPLPATFVHTLAEQIAKDHPGTEVRLYSRYPFPHRVANEAYDDFELKALDVLEKDPTTAYWKIDRQGGRRIVRYAQADVMKENCVGCHNNHPETPKTGWKVGDTRGIVAVSVPIDDVYNIISAGALKVTGWILLAASIISFSIFAIIKHSVLRPAQALRRVARVLAGGDLTVAAEYVSKDAVGQIGDSINQMTDQLRETIGKINEASAEVGTASEQLKKQTQQSYEENSDQKSQIEQVAAAMNQMSVTSQHVADNADQAAQAANGANQKVTKGKTVVTETAESIRSLASETESVAEAVRRLENDTGSIGAVLEVITNIADQTNLLALNAAIEAARAGDQGRGFAVVADEVRSLAMRTQSSTNEIHAMIERVQRGSANAAQAMEQNCSAARLTVDKTLVVEQTLSEISDKVQETTDMYAQIAHSVGEQSTVAEEMNRNLSIIYDLSQKSRGRSGDISSASDELAALASNLQQAVEHFKTG